MILAADVVTTQVSPALTTTSWIVGVVIYILMVVALWRVFSKAGWPGILSIIPIVNVFILVKIAGYSAWLGLLYIIPIVNVIFGIVVAISLGRRFGKGGAFSFFLLWLIPIIGYFILGYGSATYTPRQQGAPATA
jgi:hypothetical protein